MPGKRLNSQAQELVLKLVDYFKLEKENGGPLLSVNAVYQRVSAASGISNTLICTIQNRKAQNPVLSSPGKKRPRRKLKSTDLPEGTKMKVRNTIYEMYKNGKHVTVKNLKNELATRDVTELGCTSLNLLLKNIGFSFKKDDNRRALTEKFDIACMRTAFLRKYNRNMNDPMTRQIVFLDETWIYAKGSKTKSWQDSNIKSVRKAAYDGKRFSVLHAGNSNDFINGASLLFQSKSATGDYHGEMNGNIFTQWTTEKLIPNLEEPSLVVMDNAPYHSILVTKNPNTNWNKVAIIEWLVENKITFTDEMTKCELLYLAKQHKKEKVYIIDELLRANGHEVLRLPPYHCEFNAIELIWAKAKSHYNTNIGRDGYGDEKVLEMWYEALGTCTSEVWSNCVRHTENLIKTWYEREAQLMIEVAPLIINVTETSSESETDSN